MADVNVEHPAAAPNHPNHWRLITAAILAALQQSAVIALIPPKAQGVVEVGVAVAPILIEGFGADKNA